MAESWYGPRSLRNTATTSVAFGESLISLLLKLHSKLTDQPDSYRVPPDPQLASYQESRVGNGPHFVGQLLTFIAKKDALLKEHINQTRSRMWPRATDEEPLRSEDRETRRRMARERQQRLMRQFANRQRQFQEQMETEEPDVTTSSRQRADVREYDCVICGQSSASTAERPFGLVVLLQASSVLAHQQPASEPPQLPTDPAASLQLRHRLPHNRAGFLERRHEKLANNFDNKSWLLSMNIGVQGGVHVQTCGHHIHLDCHRMYVHSLTGHDARQQSISVQRGEYSCPLCRQLCNSVLPLMEDDGSRSAATAAAAAAAASPRPALRRSEVHGAIARLLHCCTPPEYNNNFGESISKAMEAMTHITFPKYRNTTPQSPGHENVLLFVTSIARTNLEMEVVQRGGGLTNTADAATQLVPSVKRSCLVPLLTVLGFNAKVLAVRNDNQYLPVTWAQLHALAPATPNALTLYQPDVPLLLRDPASLLMLLVLTLPLPLPAQLYYTCVVQALYNLTYVQACADVGLQLPAQRRAQLMTARQLSGAPHMTSMTSLLGLVLELLSSVPGLYPEDAALRPLDDYSDLGLATELEVRCLPFLRLAAVLRQHLYQQQLPDPRRPEHELPALIDFLELTSGSELARPASAQSSAAEPPGQVACGALRWVQTDAEPVVRSWCLEYRSLAKQSPSAARELVRQQRWYQPQLLRLPLQYKTIFLFYHRRQCMHCQTVPKEPTVCLLCGALVCLRGQCCKVGTSNEAVAHSVDCGAGTAIFLAVNSSTIIVIRGRRACLWGSVYLDTFGEEDRDLKRGRPLFLCEERYRLLQNLWISHAFDNTRRRWIWHKEML